MIMLSHIVILINFLKETAHINKNIGMLIVGMEMIHIYLKEEGIIHNRACVIQLMQNTFKMIYCNIMEQIIHVIKLIV